VRAGDVCNLSGGGLEWGSRAGLRIAQFSLRVGRRRTKRKLRALQPKMATALRRAGTAGAFAAAVFAPHSSIVVASSISSTIHTATATSLYWEPLGAPIVHPYVLASSCSFNATSGAPLVAYGAADQPDDTTTRILSWTPARTWALVATHTPQFAQPYENFNLKTDPGGFLYLGLAIDPSDFPISSVLRNEPSAGGGEDGFEGCYAFPAGFYDFELTKDRNLLAALTVDNTTLALSVYDRSGWSQYPAANTWGPNVNVSTSRAAGGLGPIATTHAASKTVFVAFMEDNSLHAGSAALADGSGWVDLGSPLGVTGASAAGAAPAVAWGALGGGAAPTDGVLCVAAVAEASGSLLVSCQFNGTSSSAWGPPAAALAGVSPRLPPALALTPSSSAQGALLLTVAAASADDSATLLTAACVLSGGAGAPSCGDWAGAALSPLTVAGGLNDFAMRSGAGGAGNVSVLLAASTGPADGTGDALVVFSLASTA
jgi:hypothetical protein